MALASIDKYGFVLRFMLLLHSKRQWQALTPVNADRRTGLSTTATPLAGPSQQDNNTIQLGADYPAIVDCKGYYQATHLLGTLNNVKAAIGQGLVEIAGTTVLSPDAEKRTKAAFKKKTYLGLLAERLEEMESFSHVSGLRPDRSELQQPHLACVTPQSGRKYAYLNLGYDPLTRCHTTRGLTAFSATDTAYIFLCPRFWNVSPSGVTNRCPTVENNQFVGDEDYFFLDSQLYQLIAQLYMFYLEGNAVTIARLDWNRCILDLSAKESVLSPQNVALWTFSTASSRPSSPASSGDGSSPQLTPRSKVKAMLAAIDDESDSDGHNQSVNLPQKTTAQAALPREDIASLSSNAYSHRSSLSPVPAPKGGLAARLRKEISSASGDLSSDDQDAGDAYSRLKQRLATTSVEVDNHGSRSSASQSPKGSDDDDILPVVKRRRRKLSRHPSVEKQSIATSNENLQRSSPGPFVSNQTDPSKTSPATACSHVNSDRDSGSGSDLPPDLQAKSRVLALVARKQAENEAKAKAEAEKKAQRYAPHREKEKSRRKVQLDSPEDSAADDNDQDGIRRLTQQSRPTRKASKKALEEMSRETQRMSRNMQLAHQARTKKKVTKESLFARFNFRTAGLANANTVLTNSSSAAASSNPASEAEPHTTVESPPTSPMTPNDVSRNVKEDSSRIIGSLDQPEEIRYGNVDEHVISDVHDTVVPAQDHVHPAKVNLVGGSSTKSSDLQMGTRQKRDKAALKGIRVRSSKPVPSLNAGQESGSDLEILPAERKHRRDVFDRLPKAKVSEERSLQKLRALAHLTSPSKRAHSNKPKLSMSEMQDSLQKRARQQAARERAEKIQDLKDRGIIIQTAEERQKDQAEVEDLLERARREAAELKQKEKDIAKKEAKANGQAVDFEDTSGEDEDYQENDADESNLELSGSDEEDADFQGSDEDDPDGEANDSAHEEDQAGEAMHDRGLVEDEASQSENDSNDEKGCDDEEIALDSARSDAEEVHKQVPTRRRKNKFVVDDEDDEMHEVQVQEPLLVQSSPQHFGDLGLPDFDGVSMGMTQAFAATMGDSQTQASVQNKAIDPEQDSLAFLGAPPEPDIPIYDMEDSPQVIIDSQANDTETQNMISLGLSQLQRQESNRTDGMAEISATQMSEIPDPTQDVGFALSSPVAGRYMRTPPSTVDTVILPQPDEPDSPIVKKRGRLRRKTKMVLDDEPNTSENAVQEADETIISANAFDILKKGSKKQSLDVEDFDKKKSNAKEMVEEQAQESEDEYAGLGGASDDESGGEEDEEVKNMIEQGNVDVDERELAAFYANKERASDEKAVEKLFKDINNGMLRRKRGGADFDLSDSEDDIEARRRRKRREFAKMRKALLENEKVGKIAEDPKKMAFLRAIEDREDDDDAQDFLVLGDEDTEKPTPESEEIIPDSQPQTTSELGKRKRPLTEATGDSTNRPPPAMRRTPAAAMRKPLSLAEIRASVSFLIEAPDAVPVAPPSSSPVASEDENDENEVDGTVTSLSTANDKRNPRRTAAPATTTAPVIDRLSLKRTSSSSLSAAGTNTSRLAFQTSAGPINTFKVPSLLRRATSSSFNPASQQDQH
ncbi:MAG: hypothetical protein Q9222_007549, partial [Ikaeria aurantiellina]